MPPTEFGENRFSQRAPSWKLRTRTIEFGRLPSLMAILNVTPDSFSDGGRYYDPDAAVEQALRMVELGADLLDVGGESTRPYSLPVDADEELRRVVPVIERLSRQTSTPISVDTSKASVARAALDAGAEIINDVTGFESSALLLAAVQSQAGVCVMHMQGTPQTMQDCPHYENVVDEIHQYLGARRRELISAGIEPARICLDPGLGFGKTHQHNLTLAAHCHGLHELGSPILVGHSRKGFIGKVLGDPQADRTAGTVGVALSLAVQGVQVLRVHDIQPVRDALRLFEASGGLDGREWILPPTPAP